MALSPSDVSLARFVDPPSSGSSAGTITKPRGVKRWSDEREHPAATDRYTRPGAHPSSDAPPPTPSTTSELSHSAPDALKLDKLQDDHIKYSNQRHELMMQLISGGDVDDEMLKLQM